MALGGPEAVRGAENFLIGLCDLAQTLREQGSVEHKQRRWCNHKHRPDTLRVKPPSSNDWLLAGALVDTFSGNHAASIYSVRGLPTKH
jgi:hypothetical protein